MENEMDRELTESEDRLLESYLKAEAFEIRHNKRMEMVMADKELADDMYKKRIQLKKEKK